VPPPLRRRVSVADVMQETWLVAFRRIAEFEDRGDGAFDAWLAAIADLKLREAVRHHLLTEKRAGLREVTRGARPNSSAFAGREPSPSDAAIGEETRSRAERALAGLPEDYRQVLLLVQVEGLTLAGAAARMERSYEATKKLYGRAVSRLAKEMQSMRGDR
jgi:RNA polymerase sigma-70 factor (ECF subfamily)